MLDDSYFYNATIRKSVAIFGSVFNNIYVGKLISGKLNDVYRVPLSYGPRERFLARIRNVNNVNNADVAIKLPRMSFEITSLNIDNSSILNRNNTRKFQIDGNSNETITVRQAVPYILSMQLSVYADNQDSGLQIVEQILPNFKPEYTLSVKDMEGPGTNTDVPIILKDVTLQDDYEGDFESGRRQIIYTLNFDIKIKIVGATTNKAKIIKSVIVDLFSSDYCSDPNAVDRTTVSVGENDTPDNYTVVTTFGFDE